MAVINGTVGSDNLIGTGLADIIDGLEGDDTISGRGGADSLIGGIGKDSRVNASKFC